MAFIRKNCKKCPSATQSVFRNILKMVVDIKEMLLSLIRYACNIIKTPGAKPYYVNN